METTTVASSVQHVCLWSDPLLHSSYDCNRMPMMMMILLMITISCWCNGNTFHQKQCRPAFIIIGGAGAVVCDILSELMDLWQPSCHQKSSTRGRGWSQIP